MAPFIKALRVVYCTFFCQTIQWETIILLRSFCCDYLSGYLYEYTVHLKVKTKKLNNVFQPLFCDQLSTNIFRAPKWLMCWALVVRVCTVSELLAPRALACAQLAAQKLSSTSLLRCASQATSNGGMCASRLAFYSYTRTYSYLCRRHFARSIIYFALNLNL